MIFENQRILMIYILFMFVIILWGGIDIYLDMKEFIEDPFHYIVEAGFIAFALFSGSFMLYRYLDSVKALRRADSEIQKNRETIREWSRRHEALISGFREEVLLQLKNWGLSAAETEVAMLLLRGYSHKSISGILSKSERTVRNQSIEIYRKMGMTGRNELAAFFLEELLGNEEDPE